MGTIRDITWLLADKALDATFVGRAIKGVVAGIYSNVQDLSRQADSAKRAALAAMAARAYCRMMDAASTSLDLPPEKTLLYAQPGTYTGQGGTSFCEMAGMDIDEEPTILEDPRFWAYPEWLPTHVHGHLYQTAIIAPDPLTEGVAWVTHPELRLTDVAREIIEVLAGQTTDEHDRKRKRRTLRRKLDDMRSKRNKLRENAPAERERLRKIAVDTSEKQTSSIFKDNLKPHDEEDPEKPFMRNYGSNRVMPNSDKIIGETPELRTKGGKDRPTQFDPLHAINIQTGTYVDGTTKPPLVKKTAKKKPTKKPVKKAPKKKSIKGAKK